MVKKTLILKWLQVVAGLLVFSFGVHLTIFANIGHPPWDCLGMGLALHTPLTYGLSMTVMAVVILIIDLLLGERIGVGTILDALLTGNFVQAFNDLNPFPMEHSLPAGIGIMLVGFVFMAFGMFFSMSAAQCCGPRDTLLVGLGKRMPRVPIGVVWFILWAVVLLAGWLLGGPVGIGTVIGTFGSSLVVQLIYSIIRFEPRDVRHRDVLTTARLFFGKKAGD